MTASCFLGEEKLLSFGCVTKVLISWKWTVFYLRPRKEMHII